MLILILPWSRCQMPCMRRPHCRPKAARSRLTPTLLNPYRFRKVMRKPKPMKIMTWTSWNTADTRGEVSCADDWTSPRGQNSPDLTASDRLFLNTGDECSASPLTLGVYDLMAFSYYHHVYGKVNHRQSEFLIKFYFVPSVMGAGVEGTLIIPLWGNSTPVIKRSFLKYTRNACAHFKTMCFISTIRQ